MKGNNIYVISGPTGGHLFPAISVAQELKKTGQPIILITSPRAKKYFDGKEVEIFNKIVFLQDFPFPRGLSYKIIPFLFYFSIACIRCLFLYLTRKPQVCVGFGSYISVPSVWIGKHLFGAKVVLHEQNAVTGMATKFLTKCADKICLSFKKTVGLASEDSNRWSFTGLPLRRQFYEVSNGRQMEDEQKALRILILGGSQGSREINEACLSAFSKMTSEDLQKIVVKHITGSLDYSSVKEAYQAVQINTEIMEFSKDMPDLYAWSDLVLCRAGASTLFELQYFRKPAICVPYAYAESHQSLNAEPFERAGCLRIVPKEVDLGDYLGSAIKDCLDSGDLLQEISQNWDRFGVERADQRVAQEVVAIASAEGASNG